MITILNVTLNGSSVLTYVMQLRLRSVTKLHARTRSLNAPANLVFGPFW